MKVLMENFSENSRDQVSYEDTTYKRDEQGKKENELKDIVITRQKSLRNEEFLWIIKFLFFFRITW